MTDTAAPRAIASLADLTPDRDNANLGNERGSSMLEASLRQFGAGRSILADRDGRVIAGNKTLEQAAALGLEIEVVRTRGDKLVVVQREDLDLREERGRGLAYMDNRTSEVSLVWDAAQIARDAEAGMVPDAGFSDTELALMLDAARATPPSLDDLEDEFGDFDETDFWPEIKLKVDPETRERFDSVMRLAAGASDAEKLRQVLDAVDTGLLG